MSVGHTSPVVQSSQQSLIPSVVTSWHRTGAVPPGGDVGQSSADAQAWATQTEPLGEVPQISSGRQASAAGRFSQSPKPSAPPPVVPPSGGQTQTKSAKHVIPVGHAVPPLQSITQSLVPSPVASKHAEKASPPRGSSGQLLGRQSWREHTEPLALSRQISPGRHTSLGGLFPQSPNPGSKSPVLLPPSVVGNTVVTTPVLDDPVLPPSEDEELLSALLELLSELLPSSEEELLELLSPPSELLELLSPPSELLELLWELLPSSEEALLELFSPSSELLELEAIVPLELDASVVSPSVESVEVSDPEPPELDAAVVSALASPVVALGSTVSSRSAPSTVSMFEPSDAMLGPSSVPSARVPPSPVGLPESPALAASSAHPDAIAIKATSEQIRERASIQPRIVHIVPYR